MAEIEVKNAVTNPAPPESTVATGSIRIPPPESAASANATTMSCAGWRSRKNLDTRLRTPVRLGEEHDDRNDLEPSQPHEDDHDRLRGAAERIEGAEGPGEAESRADVAERRSGGRDRVEDAKWSVR